MKSNKILYYVFLFVIVVVFAFYNVSNNNIENFTPKIREFYRPILRNTRHFGEQTYNKLAANISNFFRKFGIM
jgi:hypothetical protein